jgi:hypothetical protein
MGRAGLAAVGPLLEILAESAAAAAHEAEDMQTQAHVAVDAAHAIAQAVTTAAAVVAQNQNQNHALLLQACAHAVDGLAAAIVRAAAELDRYAAEHPVVEEGGDGLQRVGPDKKGRPAKTTAGGGDGIQFYPLERRRLMAEAACSLGLVGQTAITAAAASGGGGDETSRLCAKAVQALHPLVVMAVDPGARFRNFMYGTTVQTNAAMALCRLCTTVPGRSGAAVVSHPPDQEPDPNLPGSSMGRQ